MQYETKDTKEEMEARRRRTAAAAAACASIESPLLGLASAAGMCLGHYIARITAGLLYAVQLKHDPTVPAWILSLLIRVGLWYYYPGVQASRWIVVLLSGRPGILPVPAGLAALRHRDLVRHRTVLDEVSLGTTGAMGAAT